MILHITLDKVYIIVYTLNRGDFNANSRRFISDVKVLCEDIVMLYDNDERRKARLVALLSDTLQLSDYKGDECFETFKKDMDEKILRELHNYEYAHGKQLNALLREYQAEKGTTGMYSLRTVFISWRSTI